MRIDFFQERHELLSFLSAPSEIRTNIFQAGPSHSNVTLIALIRIGFDVVGVRGRWSIIQLDQKPSKKKFHLQIRRKRIVDFAKHLHLARKFTH